MLHELTIMVRAQWSLSGVLWRSLFLTHSCGFERDSAILLPSSKRFQQSRVDERAISEERVETISPLCC